MKSKRRSGSMSRERWESSTTPSFPSLTCHSVQEEMQSEKLGWDLTEPRTWSCQGGMAGKVQSLGLRLDVLHNHMGVGRCHKFQASFLLFQRYLTVWKQTYNENNSQARTSGQMKLGGGRWQNYLTDVLREHNRKLFSFWAWRLDGWGHLSPRWLTLQPAQFLFQMHALPPWFTWSAFPPWQTDPKGQCRTHTRDSVRQRQQWELLKNLVKTPDCFDQQPPPKQRWTTLSITFHPQPRRCPFLLQSICLHPTEDLGKSSSIYIYIFCPNLTENLCKFS